MGGDRGGMTAPNGPPRSDPAAFRKEFKASLGNISQSYTQVVSPLMTSIRMLGERAMALETRFGPIEAAGPAPSLYDILETVRADLEQRGFKPGGEVLTVAPPAPGEKETTDEEPAAASGLIRLTQALAALDDKTTSEVARLEAALGAHEASSAAALAALDEKLEERLAAQERMLAEQVAAV